MKTLNWLAVAVVVVLFLPATARAQDDDDEKIVAGAGVKLSDDYVLRPSAGAQVGFTSNVFYEEANARASAILQILGGFSIESITAAGRTAPVGEESSSGVGRNIDYGMGLQLRYEEYLTGDEAVQAQRDLAAQANARLIAMPGRWASFFLNDQFTRDTRSPNFESSDNLVRYINVLRAGVRFQPAARSLSGYLRYQNTIDAFADFDFADRFQHEIQGLARWHWLPVTSIYLRASQGIYSPLGDGQLGGMPYKVNSYPLDLRAGIDTAITELTTVKLFAGWSFGFYEAGADYSSVIYGVSGGWRYSPLGRVVLTFTRDFRDSINANFYGEYSVKLSIDQQIKRFSVKAHALGALRTYEGIPDQISVMDDTRTDAILSIGASASYYLQDSIALTAAYDLSLVETDFRGAAGGEPDDPSYVRHQLLVGAHAAF